MEATAHFCPECGTNQGVKVVYIDRNDKPVGLIVLCVLTICGSLFTIGRAIIYELFAAITEDEGIATRGLIYILTSVGTIIGAVLMISRKLIGLYIYSVSQVIYIITLVIAIYTHNSETGFVPRNGLADMSGIMIFYFGLPALIFLGVYWLKDIRKYLY
ncbi:hypothetical protein KAOT1_09661 [Kordia algicida OT-1]|uniref:Uncharacterized protein n=2 Tax=Kordia TaxID=221065 RepID=A9E476_9FLAO|nr:hypothetical protein KAOT1_09661 [Kordia algicida OT-1]